MTVRMLELEAATPESVAPFGSLISTSTSDGHGTAFYENAVTIHGTPPFRSDADTCLAIARVAPRDCKVVFLERHFKHTQVFLPLNGQPYVVVLAPPTTGPVPDPSLARAFQFAGDCGLLMNIGTWHEFPFALTTPVDMIVILRNETNRNLDAIENGEAAGEDLQKRNILVRCGIELRFAG
jgi:ureidoglycolate lyase